LPERKDDDPEPYDDGRRDVKASYKGEVVLGSVIAVAFGAMTFGAVRLYKTRAEKKVRDNRKMLALNRRTLTSGGEVEIPT
jgi:hypothetical protein